MAVFLQILYLEEILFLRYRPKCSQKLDCRIFLSKIFPGEIYETAWFFACWHKLTSFHSPAFPVFSWNSIIRFLDGARNPYEVVRDRAKFSGKTFIAQINEDMARKRAFWIWKIWSLIFNKFFLQWKFILFAVFLHKSYIWEKSCSWRSKCYQQIRFLTQRFLQNKLVKEPQFLHVDTNSQKLKIYWKFLVRHGKKWV